MTEPESVTMAGSESDSDSVTVTGSVTVTESDSAAASDSVAEDSVFSTPCALPHHRPGTPGPRRMNHLL
ncbi:MAG: hypothetical protein PVI30_08740 [Myxococcales bacterium]